MDSLIRHSIALRSGPLWICAVVINIGVLGLGCDQAPATSEQERDSVDATDISNPSDGSATDATAGDSLVEVNDGTADLVDAKMDTAGGIDCKDGSQKVGCPCEKKYDWCCVDYAQGLGCTQAGNTDPPKWAVIYDCCTGDNPDCGMPKPAGKSRYCNLK